jgi:hypothetical protein
MFLAGVASHVILNQSRIGQHQINRIKAYYSALAGINLALEKIRAGAWITTPSGQQYALCRNSSSCSGDAIAYEVNSDISYRVNITITDPDGSGKRTVNATTDYIYIP